MKAVEEKLGKKKPKPENEQTRNQNPKPEDVKLEHFMHPDRRPKLLNLHEKSRFASGPPTDGPPSDKSIASKREER